MTSMNLEWRECQTGNWMAPLPDIPGYPIGGPFHFFSHLVTLLHPGWDTRNVKTVWTFDISLHLKTERKRSEGQALEHTATLTNEDLNIPGTATVEELKTAVENLSVEDVASALAAKGYKPSVD